MASKITLTAILAGVIGLGSAGLSGCYISNQHPEYNFDGEIGEEQVKYEKSAFRGGFKLEVTRKNGTKVEYYGYHFDDALGKASGPRISGVDITKDKETRAYTNDLVGAKLIEEGQKQASEYLAKILQAKLANGLEDLGRGK